MRLAALIARLGRRGAHLPGCQRVEISLVGRAGGVARIWSCAPGCPQAARAREEIERWTGHRGR